MSFPYQDEMQRPALRIAAPTPATTGVPKLPKVPGPTEIGAPLTPGVPLKLGGSANIPFSGGDATTQPVRQPTPSTGQPSTQFGANPMSTSDPMAFANTAAPPSSTGSAAGGRPGDTNPRPTAPAPAPPSAQQGASTTRMVQFANGVTGAAGSSAGAEHAVGDRIPLTGGYYLLAGTPNVYDPQGRQVQATYNGAGYVMPDGTTLRLAPSAAPQNTMTQGVDEMGRPTASWTDIGNPNQAFSAHTAATDSAIPGGSADMLYRFEDLLGIDKVGENPNATLESLGVTEQQLRDAGLGSLIDDGSWKTHTAGEQSPFNIQLGTPGAGARQDGYYEGGASTGTYHPGGEGSPLGLVNGQYIDEYGRVIDDIENAANGIDPVTHERLAPLYDQPASNTSGKNPDGAYLTDGSTPAEFRPFPTPDPILEQYPWMAPAVPMNERPGATTGVGTGGAAPSRGPGYGGAAPATGGTSAQPTTPATFPATGGIPLTPATPAPTAAPSTVPLNPDDSLLGQVITPENTIDRFGLAKDKFDTFAKATDPTYKATLRDTNRYNFGAGRGVSGMARNSIGDVATQRMNALDTQRSTFLNDALTGTIDDLYRNIGVKQQQQGFQKDLADTAFSQGVTGAQLQDMLTNSEFGRWLAESGFDRDTQAQIFSQAMQKAQLEDSLTNSAFGRATAQENAGYQDNPADIEMWLAKWFGDQASSAGRSAAESFRNLGASKGGGGDSDDSLLREFLGIVDEYRKRNGGTSTTNNGGYIEEPE